MRTKWGNGHRQEEERGKTGRATRKRPYRHHRRKYRECLSESVAQSSANTNQVSMKSSSQNTVALQGGETLQRHRQQSKPQTTK